MRRLLFLLLFHLFIQQNKTKGLGRRLTIGVIVVNSHRQLVGTDGCWHSQYWPMVVRFTCRKDGTIDHQTLYITGHNVSAWWFCWELGPYTTERNTWPLLLRLRSNSALTVVHVRHWPHYVLMLVLLSIRPTQLDTTGLRSGFAEY